MFGETRRGFSAVTKLSRKDFGLTWNKLVEAGPAVGDEVSIALDVELVKDAPKTAAK
jgi:polyisoprenoid-binding protein YceI